MIAMYVLILVVVIGVLGSLASVLSYEKVYGEPDVREQLPSRPRAGRRTRRSSRQLRELQAAVSDAEPRPRPEISQPTSRAGR